MDERELILKTKKLIEKMRAHGGVIELSSKTPLHIQYQFFKEILERLEDEKQP